jgi:hypothetical protein
MYGDPGVLEQRTSVDVSVVTERTEREAQIAAIRALQARTNVVIAIGNRIPLNNFDQWLKELDRITNHVNVHWVHLKFMMVDPLSDRPVVVTGSLMPWSEIDLKQKVWKIPAHRMKADRPHRVPLSGPAIEILLALKDNSTPDKREYVFAEPTGRPLSEKALRRACHRIDTTVSVHGLRSTFRDWVGDNTKFPRELAELALAHKLRDATEDAYRRGDALEKRRPMMEAWSRFCGPAKAAKVIPFTAA